MSDPFHLQRFVEAQDPIYARVCYELREGRKQSHWMWFIFPQVEGLGSSVMARKYALASLKEASAYLAHPILGPRIRECVQLAVAVQNRTAYEIFGTPDDLKFRSSITLFANASPAEPMFQQALQKYFSGEPDPLTLARL